jgi:hypothetical protein
MSHARTQHCSWVNPEQTKKKKKEEKGEKEKWG